MDIKVSKALNSFKLYGEYTRGEIHQAFDDGTRYVTGGRIWGRSGAIKPKLKEDTYGLFALLNLHHPVCMFSILSRMVNFTGFPSHQCIQAKKSSTI